MVIFIDALIKSYNYFKKNWKFIPLVALLDLIFLVFFGSGTSLFRSYSETSVTPVVQGFSKLGTQLLSGEESPVKILLSDPAISANLKNLILIILSFAILLYIFWILFNGASWKLASRMMGEKGNYVKFFTRFSAITAIWFGIFLIILAAMTRFVLFALLRYDPITTPEIIQTSGTVINWIFFYFMLISISLVPYTNVFENLKKTFKYGVKDAPTFIVAYAIILVSLFLNFQITYLIFQPLLNSITAGFNLPTLIIGLIRFALAAPFLTFARMYLMEVSKETVRI